jgi:hypothetical protein
MGLSCALAKVTMPIINTILVIRILNGAYDMWVIIIILCRNYSKM